MVMMRYSLLTFFGGGKVCKERSIPRLVYTSSTNAVFAGEPIEDGDEASVPCVAPAVVSKNTQRG